MGTGLSDYLDFAIDAAWQAGRLTLAHFQTGVAVERKPDASAVTIADRAGEQLIRRLIESRFPDHAIVGEEFGSSDFRSSHRWLVDPIDGTNSFVRGVPFYGVLVGLEAGNACVVGCAGFPALGQTLHAARGAGAFANGVRCRVSQATTLADATVLTSDAGPRHFGDKFAGFVRLLERSARHRGWGDCYGYALVATGRAEVMLDPLMNAWDAAAVKPIIEEAGGTFCAWDGTATIYGGSALAMPAALRDVVLATLNSKA